MSPRPTYQADRLRLLPDMITEPVEAPVEATEPVEPSRGLPEAIAEILGCDPDELRPKRQASSQ